jgi:hypothetical protein
VVRDCWRATVGRCDPLLGHEIVPGSLPLLVQLGGEQPFERAAQTVGFLAKQKR